MASKEEKEAARKAKAAEAEAKRKAKESAARAKKKEKTHQRQLALQKKLEEKEQKRREREKAERAKRKAKAEKQEAAEKARHERERARQEKLKLRSLKGDKARKALLDAMTVLALLLLMAVVVASAGFMPPGIPAGIAEQTYALAAASIILAGGSALFTTIRWEEIQRGEDKRGPKMLNRARTDIILTMVSIAALFTVLVMGVIEVLALLVFIGTISDVGSAGLGLARNFVLFQTIMLLVYLLCIIARQTNHSHTTMRRHSEVLAVVLTPVAILCILFGAVLASGIVRFAGIQVHQAVYVVTLGVLLEFVAMRIRLRLPSLWSSFARAVADARRPTEEMKDVLRKRAQRTYVIASVFVAASMAFAGVVVSGTVNVNDTRMALALVIFYVGAALILLGLLVVRLLQSKAFHRPKAQEGDELAELVSQKRRSPEDVLKIAVYSVGGLLSAVALVLAALTALDMMGWHAKFATDLFILACMFGAGPYGYFYNRELGRIAAIDEKFPDFLRDIAESARAGMTLPRALVTAAQGTYGALTPEIHKMAAQVEWGVDFGEALRRFAARTKTPLIDRTVALVVEAQRAGGSMVDILTAASEDAREIKQILSERSTQMSMYNVVVYISFFVFIVVVMVLSAQFIPAFKQAVGAASGQQVGGLKFQDFDPEDFNTVFFQAALVQAIGGGLVGGVLTRGTPIAGFIHIAVMMGLAWLSFRVIYALMTGDPEAAADAAAGAAGATGAPGAG